MELLNEKAESRQLGWTGSAELHTEMRDRGQMLG